MVFAVKYHGPTTALGSRFTVIDIMTSKRRTIPYNHGARNAAEDAAQRSYCLSIFGPSEDTWGITDVRYLGEFKKFSLVEVKPCW